MKTTPQTGSVSHATANPQHLIPKFLALAATLTTTAGEVRDLDEIRTNMTEPGYYDSDTAQMDLEELFDLLNEAAPEGFYFGAHPGDGADFGFWAFEEDAYDLDDGEETETDGPRATTTDPTEGD